MPSKVVAAPSAEMSSAIGRDAKRVCTGIKPPASTASAEILNIGLKPKPVPKTDLSDEQLKALQSYPKEDVVDGCTACTHVAYACTDSAFIYPITPSTPMAEVYEVWSGAKRLNIFGQIPVVKQLQSEAGAAGAVHGGLCVGSMVTTFTASQGLLLMIPPMYKIAGELLPCVFHVAARAIAGQALSIFGDHSDVMACRSVGWALLSSASVQEAQDLAVLAHMATVKASVPFLHFCDGFRTSHELSKIQLIDYLTIRELMDYDAIQKARSNSMNPTRPYTKGTAQGPEVYFQNVETSNPYYFKCSDHVEEAMEKFAEVVGRRYHLFDYYGAEDADDVIVIMGSGGPICHEAIDWLRKNKSEKVGCVLVRLYRPWKVERFLAALPKTVKRICVLDRVKEPGALGEPMFLDVAASLQSSPSHRHIDCIGGRYGLGSRDFTPAMVMAVFDNLRSKESRHGFTVGIDDDVTNLSLDYSMYRHIDCVPVGTTQCLFWGMGSDGTVGANKNVIKILGTNTPLKVQGYFAYSAHKAGGLTMSHLRFGPKPITSQYLLQKADFIGVHRSNYIFKYPVLDTCREGGVVVLNCHWEPSELDKELPGQFKRIIAERKASLYIINANKVAAENGMGRRINNVLMTSFFKVSGVLPFEEAISLFKAAIKKTYQRKGMHIVEANWKCVDAAVESTIKYDYDREAWLKAEANPFVKEWIATARRAEPDAFVHNVLSALEVGVDLPVSAFEPFAGGKIPPGTAGYEKRGIALNIPIVNMDKCTQCNQCSFVCPHAAIRPFLVDDDEAEKMPETFDARKCKGPSEVAGYKFRIQVSPLDCTGCELCFIACPDDALTMTPLPQVENVEGDNWKYAMSLREKGEEIDAETRKTLKGSQYYTPLMEFSGACEGCGETPYVKLLTQLFGERLVIANATGCSSIWGASYPANAYTTNSRGEGPAWGNSLFEDGAEYGYGMAVATAQRRERLRAQILRALEREATQPLMSNELHELLNTWVQKWKDSDHCTRIFREAKPLLEKEREKSPLLADIHANMDLLPKISQWIIGGDGWAYDIGYGGLDHVVASGLDVNILVLDTEVYSNTGGQTSKATPLGAVHKFASAGRLRNKKDLGALCMEYGDVYVANISSSANMTHTVRAFIEAESFDGTSIIMAYAPCIEHQYIKPFTLQIEHCKLAVDSGFWPLYRFDPRRRDLGDSPFQLDSKKIKADLTELLRKENRFLTLRRADAALADELEVRLREWVVSRHERMQLRALGDKMPSFGAAGTVPPEQQYTILFGTDTGNSEQLANRLAKVLQGRGLEAKAVSMDEISVEELRDCINVCIICSTCGQGALPPNAKGLYEELTKQVERNPTLLSKTNYSVMALGDSAYVFFCEAAKKFDALFTKAGAKRVNETAYGDDQHEEGYEGAYQEWLAEYLTEIKAPEPLNATDVPLPSAFKVEPAGAGEKPGPIVHHGFKQIELVSSKRMTPEDYDVEVRHLEFDLGGSGLRYALGDSLALMPKNLDGEVDEFCKYMGLNPDDFIKISSATKEPMSSKYAAVFSNPLTVRQLFTECVTPFTKPPRNFYENIFRYATDPAEKAELKTILDKQNRDKLRNWTTKETVSCYDVIKRYPSIKLTLEQLLDVLPIIKPRYYSIASSQKAVGPRGLHLCIGVVEWTTPSGEKRKGEMTKCISAWRPTPSSRIMVNGSIKPTVFNMPPTDKHPMLVAGMGTGLAPFRSFIQHRAYLAEQGKEIGPLSVYFGCRYRAKDYLYQEELEGLQKKGVVTELEVAFSRDQKEKDYIQHHIVKNGANFYDYMHNRDGYFYLCGSAKQVPIDVRNACVEVIMKHGQKSREDAEAMISQWIVRGKYNVEAW